MSPRKRDSASKRLARAIGRHKDPGPLARLVSPILKSPKLDWTDKRTREIAANVALTLTQWHGDVPLRKAFDEFGLDSRDPFNWVRLLRDLAEIHFDQTVRRPRGAPPKWNVHRRRLFKKHVAIALRNVTKIARKYGDPPPTGNDIAEYLRWKWPEQYQDIQAASIRRYIVSGPPGKQKRAKRH